jgi:hypothetical protein
VQELASQSVGRSPFVLWTCPASGLLALCTIATTLLMAVPGTTPARPTSGIPSQDPFPTRTGSSTSA